MASQCECFKPLLQAQLGWYMVRLLQSLSRHVERTAMSDRIKFNHFVSQRFLFSEWARDCGVEQVASTLFDLLAETNLLLSKLSLTGVAVWTGQQELDLAAKHQFTHVCLRKVETILARAKDTTFGKFLSTSPLRFNASFRALIHDHAIKFEQKE